MDKDQIGDRVRHIVDEMEPKADVDRRWGLNWRWALDQRWIPD